MKKLSIVLSFVFALCATLPVAAAPFNNANVMSDIEEEHQGDVKSLLNKMQASKQAETISYKYNYTPFVFTISTDYERSLYYRNDNDMKVNMNYKQGMLDEFHTANCYATLINKDYVLTHKSCIYLDDIETNIPDCEGCMASFKRSGMTISHGGRKIEVSNHTALTTSEDYGSGAMLLKISDLCLSSNGTKSTNVCKRVWEWMTTDESVSFGIEKNYGTIILSNIESTDNVEESFLKRSFFSPINGVISPKTVKNGMFTILKPVKSYAGEPLFHRASAEKNILVGIRLPNSDNVVKYTKSTGFKLFSPSFTKMVKKATKGNGVIVTKDLNGDTKL